MSPGFDPRELDGGVAWIISADENESQDIPNFKKQFRAFRSLSPDYRSEKHLKIQKNSKQTKKDREANYQTNPNQSKMRLRRNSRDRLAVHTRENR